jgi:hypothetical protein
VGAGWVWPSVLPHGVIMGIKWMAQSEPAATNAPVGHSVSKTITYPSSWARFKHGSAAAPAPSARSTPTPALASSALALLPVQRLPSFGDGVSWKSGGRYEAGDVNRRGEVGGRDVGRREIFWGREEVEKINNFGQGGCVFGSTPKWFQCPHSQLVAAGSLQPSGWWAGLVGSHALCAICCTLSGSTGPGTYLFRELHNWIWTFVVARKSDAWLGPIIFLLQTRANVSLVASTTALVYYCTCLKTRPLGLWAG